MKKIAVMTSIFYPTKAVEKLSTYREWNLVVVGDKKTPSDWNFSGVAYISPSDQVQICHKLSERLPWNHYSRKMIGYIYAIQQGADLIADVDDDNVPIENWGELPIQESYETLSQPGFANIYSFFSDDFIWPRGFPLDKVKQSPREFRRETVPSDVAVWQFLANGDPDVDAIHRLLFNKPVTFFNREPIVLEKSVFCPYNSQNTLSLPKAFPLLYLPATVSFRFTDILRGIVAQPILWASNLRLGFGSATMFQERNPHNYLKDFESEIPMYLHTEAIARLASESVNPQDSISSNLYSVYAKLAKEGIVSSTELEILLSWLDALESANNGASL